MTTQVREFTLADIAGEFDLASYWWGVKWCPAVHRNERGGYGIRFRKSVTVRGADQQITFDYFELDADGTISTAPRGYARRFKPGRVTDIEAALARYAEPQHDAMRIGW